MKKEKKIKKRIPAKFVTLGLLLFAGVLTLIIYFSVSISNADINELLAYNLAGLEESYNHEHEEDDHHGHDHSLTDDQKKSLDEYKKVKIVDANDFANDGYLTSTNNNLKYSYADIGGLRVGLVAKSYSNSYMDGDTLKNGEIRFYAGFKALTSSDSIKVSTVKCYVAEEWSKLNKSVSITTGYDSSYVGYSQMKFSTAERTAKIDKEINKRYLLGLKKVENPSVYVYVEFTEKGQTTKKIVRFEYNDYYINGQSVPMN